MNRSPKPGGNISNALECIDKIDSFYRQSPTANVLVNHAPDIIKSFNALRAVGMQHEAQLKALAINRQYDLKRFQEVAGGMLQSLDSILSHIHSLQKSIGVYASNADSNPNAKTVIDYTNRQIDQSIAMFNNLVFQLLNS